MTTTLGVVFRPQNPPELLRDAVLAADETGLEELWLWEDCFLESGIATAAAALAWSSRLRVGVGLLPVPLRNVALTAMEVATLHRLFPGRVDVGVGHGVQAWMGQVGARVESPLTLLREYLEALRALLRGEEVTTNGRYVNLDRVKLDWPPTGPTPIYAGAEGPRSLKLVAEAADGVILVAGTPVEEVRRMRAITKGRLIVYVHAAHNLDDLKRYAEAGADSLVLQPAEDDTDPAELIHYVARELKPTLPHSH
ncbi:LLM class flavin-dependent oxidoreductase [Allorhizocola rhizosphaerae]|uniref:LLM class flavin-dependent oxidoreductase n=1 Tax=Allorhizocola rhizosphaerae TaxID=1872709 RepID=UPI000E3CD35B|nr:LLM class flavin-dependent oxidoreductase [Allorhizocola rhizosphaerae]